MRNRYSQSATAKDAAVICLLSGGGSMDLVKAIRELYEEKERLENAIISLEQYVRTKENRSAKASKRGRRSMSSEERQEVSERMRTYWAERRGRTGDPDTDHGRGT